MELSELFNLMLGGGLAATAAAVVTMKATVRKAKAEAEKATAEAEAMRIDNTEHATRILMDNIVKPLKDEFNETKKELARNTREMARLRKAIDTANSCKHSGDCPVLDRLREHPKDGDGGEPGQHTDGDNRQRAGRSKRTGDGGDTEIGGESGDTAGQPP